MRPTSSLGIDFRKLRLTVKDVNKGFYKGNRTGSMGRHTKYGGYIIEWEKVRTYAVPDLRGFKLTPFVPTAIQPELHKYAGIPDGPRSPVKYLERWKRENGVD
ncbi:50S ribosomal protein YmL27 [Ceratocystis lukuohia]|uniref:54S ribosomal protein L27 mitochondrial n=3 Tax=Ceratocystis TaxID=5157 RepID=A0A0F8DNS9_CERFI|nr:54S ribosomal protein L27 mitochondrial [Ceratocystis platani]PHH54018.1 54S ribosomal protein L27, mitochondrial [Ceratocystis fimbriata CBS 114723]